MTTDWPTSKTPWLARDVNGNGKIDDGTELFGSSTRLSDGTKAKDGFEALAELDTNADGVLDENDATWDALLVWRDRDENRRSAPDELSSVRDAGIVRINLKAVDRAGGTSCLEDCEIARATFNYASSDGEMKMGMAIDVELWTYPINNGLSQVLQGCD